MSNEKTCVFCGREPELDRREYPFHILTVDCPTCGQYETSFEFNSIFRRRGDFTEHAKVSAYIRERTIRHLPPVVFLLERRQDDFLGDQPQATVEEIVRTFPKTVSERLDRSLLNLRQMSRFVGDKLVISNGDYPLFYVESKDVADIGVRFIAQQLVDDGYVETDRAAQFITHYWITPKGWNRISELEKSAPDSQQGFIAMWFDTSISDEPFWRAIEDAGYKPQRIDKKEHLNQISDEIIAEIRRSKFVVADFTGSRGGVYYEAGFAMGLGLPVIWTCRNDWVDQLHFDTRQYNHIVWATEEELYSKLLNRIRATIV